jgi:hypothetical protein
MATNKWLTNYAKNTTEPGEEHLLTPEAFKRALPPRFHNNITKELIDNINELIENTPLRENYRDNLLSYARILKEGNTNLKDYINAVKYVSYKLMGDSNIEAYTKTFPDRYARMLSEGYDQKTIASHVTAWHKRKTVTKILEQSLVPSWLLNQDLYQKAVNATADLMLHASSERIRADAANNLLTHLKMPETAKVELDVNVKENDVIAELRKATLELVAQQRAQIQAGAMSAKDIAEQNLIVEGEYDVVEDKE